MRQKIDLDIEYKEKIEKIVELLKQSKSILFITGAGISADSGLPTYRGIGGLYNDKTTSDGIPIEMALAAQMLESRPEVTWKYLSQIEERCRHARFNRGHEVIAEMEKHFPRVWVLTQNIDGFHYAAGSRNVIEIHGNFHKLFCPRCAWRTTVKDYSQLNIPPQCPGCRYIIRPEVVFFGELLPAKELETLTNELQKGFDLYFSVGTTSVFPYIQQPILLAKSLGRHSIEINPAETEVSHLVNIKLPLKAKEALDAIWREYSK
jgi:NAD-dependent deacetylase